MRQRTSMPRPATVCPMSRMTGQFATMSRPRGLRVGEQQQVLLGDVGRGTQMRPDPVEVARVPPEMKPSRSASRAPSITGTAPRSMTPPTTPEARHILYRWPSSPKPVTSVAARTPAARGLRGVAVEPGHGRHRLREHLAGLLVPAQRYPIGFEIVVRCHFSTVVERASSFFTPKHRSACRVSGRRACQQSDVPHPREITQKHCFTR